MDNNRFDYAGHCLCKHIQEGCKQCSACEYCKYYERRSDPPIGTLPYWMEKRIENSMTARPHLMRYGK